MHGSSGFLKNRPQSCLRAGCERSFTGKASAVGREAAAPALRAAGDADGSSVQHQPVAEIRRLLRRQNRAQLRFDLCRVLALGEPQKVCDADAVRVADVGGLVVDVAENEVRGLASMPGRLVSSSIVPGTLPPYFSRRIFAHSTRSLDLVL